jgi:uncharacterized protein (TIGR04255 family)
MPEPQPKFERPPVIETVLGVQFDRLTEFSTAHAGWFWKTGLPPEEEYVTAKDAPRLDDQMERFGEERVWSPMPGLRVRPSEPERVQIVNRRGDRMVQIQDSRFIYNWRKKDTGYPSFEVLLPEFRVKLQAYRQFAEQAGLGQLRLNQWEVTYVNHLLINDLWTSPRDWQQIVSGFFAPRTPDYGEFESFSGEWHHVLGRNRGRLHVAFRHGRVSTDGPEMIVLTLTARGPVDGEYDWESGVDLGHDAIVRTFANMTSPEAHRHWGRTV